MKSTLGLALFLVASTIVTGAHADDWIAQRLLGPAQQQTGGQWVAINKDDSIPDGHVVRTLAGGRITLVRGTETIELSANTQITIHDQGGSKPFTTVTQTTGSVTIEADIRNVRHFAVDTPFLAAVVKGTKFTVATTKDKSSVSVSRGHVEVDSAKNKSTTLLSVGQQAQVDAGGSIAVSGDGTLPIVYAANGKALGVTEKGAKGNAYGIAKQEATSGKGAGGGKDNGNGDGNGNGNGGGNGNGNGGGNGNAGGKK